MHNAKYPSFYAMKKKVGFVLYPDFQIVDATGPAAVFEIGGVMSNVPYAITMLSYEGGLVRSSSGISLHTQRLDPDEVFDTLIVVGSAYYRSRLNDETLASYLRQQASQTRRMCSVCTGAFFLADAGLLNGRRVTTHWQDIENLRLHAGEAEVERDAIYIHDGQVWTSGGITAGIDMALALLTEDAGENVAQGVAQTMVLYYHRPGGEAQISPLIRMATGADRFSSLLGWIRANLATEMTVDLLADQMGMSPRNFSRSFKLTTGMSPAKAVETLRLEAARERVINGKIPIELIADQTGFGDPERLRRAFNRVYGMSPQRMRQSHARRGREFDTTAL
ncbi:GlxA family transcriptional regulator [Asaia sp. HN010]|uniref:GlxA family transcriptional regulator n=1 Tax=Asaia sp. HN010 TaxID=3081233 RepID=UPI0030175C88